MNNSMINPSVVDLLEKTHDRYSLVLLSAKRARQIIDGSKPQVDAHSHKPWTIAIHEIDEDAIKFERVNEEAK